MADQGFLTTRWSLIRSAASSGSPSSRAALEELCGAYWYPLYAFVRRRGHGPEEAEDLVQGFFARVLERRDLGALDPEGGRFRAWLRVSLRNYLASERDKAAALIRGGGARPVPIDAGAAEERWSREPACDETPERAFERAWARAVLEHARGQLEREYQQAGRGELFDLLWPTLGGGVEEAGRGALAAKLGMTENALNVAAHRLRQRFRSRLRREVAQTLADPTEVEGELRALFEALA